jgi:hypothetical protein
MSASPLPLNAKISGQSPSCAGHIQSEQVDQLSIQTYLEDEKRRGKSERNWPQSYLAQQGEVTAQSEQLSDSIVLVLKGGPVQTSPTLLSAISQAQHAIWQCRCVN